MTTVTVVAPLYRTRACVPELLDRLGAVSSALGDTRVVLVDDACPERSYEAALAHQVPSLTVDVYRHERNHGQHAAVMTGLRHSTGDVVVVMDGDLQDAPEDVPTLVGRCLATGGTAAVAAGRSGGYESAGRMRSGRCFRRAMAAVTRGRIAPDAGMFVALPAGARDRIMALGDPRAHLLAALGRAGVPVRSVPLERHERPTGTSGHTSRDRLRIASRALLVASPLGWLPPLFDAARRGPVVATRLPGTTSTEERS